MLGALGRVSRRLSSPGTGSSMHSPADHRGSRLGRKNKIHQRKPRQSALHPARTPRSSHAIAGFAEFP